MAHEDLDVRDPFPSTDADLIAAARETPGPGGEVYLDELYRRFYPKVASWCVKTCRDREEAADLAQEVFMRVHLKLHTYRGESSFSTWLYTVMRSVAINWGLARQRREQRLQPVARTDGVDEGKDPLSSLARDTDLRRLRHAMKERLEPMEARVLYLHYVDGLTLPAITRLLDLRNKSGAKAFIVSGKRKLRRDMAERGRAAHPFPGVSP